MESGGKRKIYISTAISVIIILTGVFIIQSSFSSSIYSLKISQILESVRSYIGKEFKVTGTVVRDSIAKDDFSMKFSIADEKNNHLQCSYSGTVPDPFAENREVILLGTMKNETEMLVSKITVKCPSKYEDQEINIEDDQDYYQNKYKAKHRK